jgi:hypothetical protein
LDAVEVEGEVHDAGDVLQRVAAPEAVAKAEVASVGVAQGDRVLDITAVVERDARPLQLKRVSLSGGPGFDHCRGLELPLGSEHYPAQVFDSGKVSGRTGHGAAVTGQTSRARNQRHLRTAQGHGRGARRVGRWQRRRPTRALRLLDQVVLTGSKNARKWRDVGAEEAGTRCAGILHGPTGQIHRRAAALEQLDEVVSVCGAVLPPPP